MKKFLTLILFLAAASQNLCAHELNSKLKFSNKASMTWFGLPIYEAKLFTKKNFSFDEEFILELKYDTGFEGGSIAKRCMKEINVVAKPSAKQQEEWLAKMMKIFPDVKKGDVIAGVYSPKGVAKFYYNKIFLGEVSDKEFAKAFFSIWFDEKTSEPEVRKQLLAGL